MSIETEQDLETYVQPPELEHIDLITPARLDFAPWHRPRKQFVRKKQWVSHIRDIINRNNILREGRPFSYLTLPGPDLLDVRLVADICESERVKLHYLGFCKANEEESERLRRNVSEFETSRTECVARRSKVVIAPIQDIQRHNSEAHVALSHGGTYDAINIDACNPIALRDRNVTGRLIDTIRHLTSYQINNCRDSWVLFLTSPIQIDSISSESLSAISSQIEQNTTNSSEFANEMSNQFNQGESFREYVDRISSNNSKEFLSLVSLGLTKWLMHLGEQGHYRVKIMKPFCYSTFGRPPLTPNMVSLCFLFKPMPMPITDGTGLTRNPNQNIRENISIRDHIKALESTNEIENIDEILSDDENLLTQMIGETKDLLRQAGYKVDHPAEGYDAWLARNP